MESSSQSSNPSDSDDAPDISNAMGTAKNKGRVRFNSRADRQQQTLPFVPSPAITYDQLNTPARPQSILRENSRERIGAGAEPIDPPPNEDSAAAAARIRAHTMADTVRRESAPSSRSSFESVPHTGSDGSGHQLLGERLEFEMQDIGHWDSSRQGQNEKAGSSNQEAVSTFPDSTYTAHAPEDAEGKPETKEEQKVQRNGLDEIYNASYDGSYNVPTPSHYRGSVLSQLMRLANLRDFSESRSSLPSVSSPGHKRTPSGSDTPTRRKWYEQNESQDTLATLVAASTKLGKPAQPQADGKAQRPTKHKSRLSAMWRQEETHITIHIAGTLARQDFILKLCRALMLWGAPTHRLEEYLTMTGRALEIECQFLYIPGCMIISFDDTTTHTTEVKLVRLSQGIDLGRLKDVHRIYKEVLHDVIGVEEATSQLDELLAKPHKFHPWFRVLIFGLTSVTAAPFSFHARLIDLPLCFFFGSLVGFLQLIASPKFSLYSNVFEVTATVIVSFLARAFGSIHGGRLFCFSALAQGGIVMLLPGYMFLSSSLELQAKAIVPGSIRIVYGVIYSLLLGFGITVGSALYGFIDSNATSNLTCHNPIPSLWGLAFVPFFVLCISILYQAKWKQMPVMVTIACAGYVVNYFSSLNFSSAPQISSALGALAVGCFANLYSRFRHGVAAAILIPAIFTQVPGGLASTGGLLSGMKIANEINNASYAANGTSYEQIGLDLGASSNSVVFSVAGSMVQVSLAITVGLFISALIVYPLGKRRSGLFSF